MVGRVISWVGPRTETRDTGLPFPPPAESYSAVGLRWRVSTSLVSTSLCSRRGCPVACVARSVPGTAIEEIGISKPPRSPRFAPRPMRYGKVGVCPGEPLLGSFGVLRGDIWKHKRKPTPVWFRPGRVSPKFQNCACLDMFGAHARAV